MLESAQSAAVVVGDELVSDALISSAIPIPGTVASLSENDDTCRILIDRFRRFASDSNLLKLDSEGSRGLCGK